MEYGSTRYRLAESSPRIVITGDVVIASNEGERDDGILQSIALADGRTRRAEAVVSFTTFADRVYAIPRNGGTRVRAYDRATLAIVSEAELPDEGAIVAACASHVAVALTSGAVVLVDRESLENPRVVAIEEPRALAFSHDGRSLAVGTEAGHVVIVDVAKAAAGKPLLGGRSPAISLAWNETGSSIAAGCGKTALAWSAAGGKAKTIAKAKLFLSVLAFHDGAVIVHDLKQSLSAIDASSLAVRWTVPQYGPAIVRGDRAIGARFGDVHTIDLATGAIACTIAAPNIHVDAFDVAGDVIALVLSTGNRLVVGDLAAATWHKTPEGHEAELEAVSFAGSRFATGGRDTRAMVWERGTADPIASFLPPSGSGTDRCGAVLVDGDFLVAGMGDHVHRFPLHGGAPVMTADLVSDVCLLVRAGDKIVACSESGRRSYGALKILDAASLSTLHEERLDRVFDHAHVDGAKVRLWCGLAWAIVDLDKLAIVERGEVESDDYSRDHYLSRDAKVLVSTDTRQERGRLRATDAATKQELFESVETEPFYGRGDLDPTGARLATTHEDGTIRIWSARTGALASTIEPPLAITSVRWFPDGAALLAWNDEGAVVEIAVP